MKISCNGFIASIEYAIIVDSCVQVASIYDRSLQTLKAISANAQKNPIRDVHRGVSLAVWSPGTPYKTFFQPVTVGKERFYHALMINDMVGSKCIICEEGAFENSLYEYLMANYSLPLLKEWMSELASYFISERKIRKIDGAVKTYGDTTPFITLNDKKIDVKDLEVYSIFVSQAALEKAIKTLFDNGLISLCDEKLKPLEVTELDGYFEKYSHSIVKNLEETIEPLSELNGNIDTVVFNNMRLYPQQVAQANGVIELLKRKNHAIINQGMGTGKTLETIGICEGYFNQKYLASHPKETMEDILTNNSVSYRNIVMCPGHLVEKWAAEIEREVPYAKVTILKDFSQFVSIRFRGKERNGKEWFVVSKDFAKLSYPEKPVPTAVKKRTVYKAVCRDCGLEKPNAGKAVCKCGCNDFKLVSLRRMDTGMVCPECGELLFPYVSKLNLEDRDVDKRKEPLMPEDFAGKTTSNKACYYCDASLWQPHVSNIGAVHQSKWVKMTHWANKTHKGKKTVWVHRKYEDDYCVANHVEPLDVDYNPRGLRKYSPASYIKKQLKGFFDIAIFDEMHLYKGGATAQGNAMHAILKSAKKAIGLTGTIAGGYANHLFYVLYRLDPQRMRERGFAFTDVLKFSEQYGTVVKTYEHIDDDSNSSYNASSRGRQISTPKVKPGISPLIFTDFLLDKTVFLDLTDMSKYLPELHEYVVEVPVEKEIVAESEAVIKVLKATARKKEGRGVLGAMLQFALSYPDKPYGVSPIVSPIDGSVIAKPADLSHLVADGRLLNKERKLVEIVKEELSEDRKCVIFCEFTGSKETIITQRLKDILEKELNLYGKVAILESSSPKAIEREAWMHKKAAEGIEVFITNPKNVETGLDFAFIHNGVYYSYSTLIFYQNNYSLQTTWQASCRHYRLNQRNECRTYYLCGSGTLQPAVIQILAEKKVATAAIQGKFSTEGLAAMAQGVDAKLRLAQALSEKDFVTGNKLQDMFDVVAQSTADEMDLSEYTPMRIFSEVVGDIIGDVIETVKGNEADNYNMDKFMEDFKAFAESIGRVLDPIKPRRKELEGQCFLFEF